MVSIGGVQDVVIDPLMMSQAYPIRPGPHPAGDLVMSSHQSMMPQPRRIEGAGLDPSFVFLGQMDENTKRRIYFPPPKGSNTQSLPAPAPPVQQPRPQPTQTYKMPTAPKAAPQLLTNPAQLYQPPPASAPKPSVAAPAPAKAAPVASTEPGGWSKNVKPWILLLIMVGLLFIVGGVAQSRYFIFMNEACDSDTGCEISRAWFSFAFFSILAMFGAYVVIAFKFVDKEEDPYRYSMFAKILTALAALLIFLAWVLSLAAADRGNKDTSSDDYSGDAVMTTFAAISWVAALVLLLMDAEVIGFPRTQAADLAQASSAV